jgi:multidrug efflux pump subunit AcrB
VALLLAGLLATVFTLQRFPTAFIPQEDTGQLRGVVILPEGTALPQTQKVLEEVRRLATKEPAIRSANFYAGRSFGDSSPNKGQFFLRLKPVRERRGADESSTAVGERLRLTLSPIGDAMIVLGDKGSIDGDVVLADIKRHEAPDLVRALIEKGVDVTEARWVGTDLEAIFFTETGAVQAPETIHAG